MNDEFFSITTLLSWELVKASEDYSTGRFAALFGAIIGLQDEENQ